ncbi:MAG: tetratricopeptide repeat protein [bacterium]
MVTNKLCMSGLRVIRRFLAGAVFLLSVSSILAGDEQTEIQNELKFASELIKAKFPDYAQKSVDKLLIKYPAAKAEASRVRIEVLTSRGKFDEAEAVLKTMPPGTPETIVMYLAVGDQYYAFSRMKDAQRIYEGFFKQFPKGPPAEVARLYGESAYKFSQMLLLVGDLPAALEAYRRVLTCPLNSSEIERRVKTEIAELCLRVAQLNETPAAKKKDLLAEALKLCNEVQWSGTDLWFAKTLVIMAHIHMVNGDPSRARKVLTDYMGMLSDVDKMLRESKESSKLSPMAECKFLLGTLCEDEARALMSDKTKDPETIKLFAQAMSQFYTVAQNYPGSTWAPEARRRADGIADMLETDYGKTVKRPERNNTQMVSEQLKEARVLFQNQEFKASAEKYIEVLNMADDFKGAPWAVSELARSYIELNDAPYAQAMTGFLAERYSQTTNRYEEGGNALLAVAVAYDERKAQPKADAVYDLFFANYPDHSKAPAILFRQGEVALRLTNYVAALKNYQRIVETYPRNRAYPDALSRAGYCLSMLGDHTNAIPMLTNYIAQVFSGAEMVTSRLRLADEYRQANMIVPALNEYARLLKLIAQDSAKYSETPEDVARVKRATEFALYSKAQCYSRLRDPADQIPSYQQKAVEGYELFMKDFPKSELAPAALGAMGTLNYLMNKADVAGKCFERLKADYPNSVQALDTVFVRADALMSMGDVQKAVVVFGEMLKSPQSFKPTQFLRAGRVLLEAQEYDVAKGLFAEAIKTQDVPLWQAASLGYGQALVGAADYEAAIGVYTNFLGKYAKSGYVIEVNLSLSRAYAEMGKKMPEAQKAKPYFDKAYGAMGKVRQYARDPELLVRADLEMAAIQLLQGDKMGAMASYMKILLFTDPSNQKVRPLVEQAFDNALPLMKDLGRYQDMVEACETYLKQFPTGRLVIKARQGRDEAKARLATGR